jgi:hypothetical protein
MEDKHKDYKEYGDYEDLADAIEKLETAAVSPIEPDPQFRASARKRILNSLPEVSPERSDRKRANIFKKTAFRLAAAFTAIALALSGVAFASTDSLPDDTLYPVKRLVEQGRVVLTRNDEARAGVYADLADRRLAEIEALVKAKRTAKIETTLQLMGSEYDSAQAAANKLPTEKKERIMARLETAVTRQQTQLDGYSKNKTVPQAVINRNLERIKKNRERIRELRLERREERRQQIQERRRQQRQKQMPVKSKATP